MFLQKSYSVLLGLYPADFRARFGKEMIAVFEQAAARSGERGKISLMFFAAREMFGLVAGAARERMPRHVANPACDDLPFPSDIAGAELYVELVSKRLIHAIANHDFTGARHYDRQDREARALLAQLREQRA